MKRITKISSMLLLLLMTAWTQMFAAAAVEGTATGTGAEFLKESLALKYNELTNGQKIFVKSANAGVKNAWLSLEKKDQGRYLSTTLTKANLLTVVETEQINNTFTFVLKRESDGNFLKSDGTLTTSQDEAVKLQAVNPSGNFDSADSYYPQWDTPQNGNYTYLVRFVQASATGTILNVNNPKAFATGIGSWTTFYIIDANGLNNITINQIDEKQQSITASSIIFYEQNYTVQSLQKPFYTLNKITKNDNTEIQEGETITQEDATLTYEYSWNLPFEKSTVNSDGTLDMNNAKWYLLKLGDNYVSYNESDETYINVNAQNDYSDKYWWAFSGDYTNGIKVYNKATGATKIMVSVSPGTTDDQGGITYPHLVEASTVASDNTLNENWTIYPSTNYTNENGFYLSREGETAKLNNYATQGKLAFWVSSQGAGSTFRTISITEANAALKDVFDYANKRNAIGSIKADQQETFYTELAKNSIEGLYAANALAKNAENITAFDPALYYRIENVMRKRTTGNTDEQNNGGYLEVIDFLELPAYNDHYGFNANDRDDSRAQAIWKFVSTSNEGEYNLLNLNASVYLGAVNTDNTYNKYFKIGSNDIASATVFTLKALGNGQYNIYQAGTNNRIHISGSYDNNKAAAMLHDGGELNSPSAWYLVPATTIDLEISEAGYATVKYPFAVQVPTGVKAYIGTADAEAGVFTLKEIEGTTIPANTPVILEGSAKVYTLNILADNTEAPLSGNDLNGCTAYKNFATTENAYILGNGTNGIGFYQMDGTDRTLAANKAYLVLPQEASAVRSIVFSDGTTTGIESTVAEGTETEEYYDLQGRRVMNPTKGIYVTKSGKKVLINK